MASHASQQQRLALIIGINNYPSPETLNYCINDAKDLEAKLKTIKFRVTPGFDCDKDKFNSLINDFVNEIKPGDLVLFYFAGHGNQFEDKNYLLPAGYSYDHSTNERKYIEENSINAQYILHQIGTKRAHATICILDCCRIYVKLRATTSQQGLAAIKGPPESIIAFSCGFNQGGIDETQNNRNGIFTEYLLKYIATSNQDIETVLLMVAKDIKAKGFPLPWRASCLTEKIYLMPQNPQGARASEIINDIKADYEASEQFQVAQVDQRNIMLIGRPRTGKSTIKSLIVDATAVTDAMTLKSGTRDPLFESFQIRDHNIVLNIIDTPGMFEYRSTEIDARDNETILRTIKLCANHEITKIHVLCFCLAITAGIQEEDIISLKLLANFLGNEISRNSCLIITRCESMCEDQRMRILEELSKCNSFKETVRFFRLGIFFSGSLNRDDMHRGDEGFCEGYHTIRDYRTRLIELFTSNIEPFPISEMVISNVQGFCEEDAHSQGHLSKTPFCLIL